mmetsp:Transcript_3747/g.8799  ORF Transcript_3747/g.8799 Transcript_3747/m.8799 type:complete len:355 (+) Transcript_3747:159-1223(+)
MGPQDVEHPSQRARRGVAARNHEVQHRVPQVRGELGVGHAAFGLHGPEEPSEEVLAVWQVGVVVALGNNSGGFRVQQGNSVAELLVALAAVPLPAHGQPVQASKGEWQQLAEVRREQRFHHVLHEGTVGRVESGTVGVALPSQGISVHPKEQMHDAVHGVVEEMNLHVYLLPGLDDTDHPVHSVHKSIGHGGGHVGSREDLRRNLPLPQPVVPGVGSPHPVWRGENSTSQPLPKGILNNTIAGLGLGVHIEFILEVVLDELGVANGQGDKRWVPEDPCGLGHRETDCSLISPMVTGLGEIPLGLHRPQQPMRCVPRPGHIFEHATHPKASPQLPGQGADDLDHGELGVDHQAPA